MPRNPATQAQAAPAAGRAELTPKGRAALYTHETVVSILKKERQARERYREAQGALEVGTYRSVAEIEAQERAVFAAGAMWEDALNALADLFLLSLAHVQEPAA